MCDEKSVDKNVCECLTTVDTAVNVNQLAAREHFILVVYFIYQAKLKRQVFVFNAVVYVKTTFCSDKISGVLYV